MTAGIGATGFIGVAFETVKGTYVPPFVHVPVLSEGLKYTEEKYYSPQLRQQVVDSTVTPGYYHIEGPIEMEVDPHFMPYFLFASRHECTKGGAGPYTYEFVPTTAGASSTAVDDVNPKTLSILAVRNGVGFGYTGCVVSQFAFTVDAGVLKVTMDIVGEGEAEQTPSVPSWLDPELYGADSHNVFVAEAAASPTWGTAADGFNGFTFTVNHNAEAQNRIRALRSASFVKYGKTDISIDSELDFDDRTEYDKFVASDTAAFKLESTVGGGDITTAASGITLEAFRCAYDAYDINVGSIDAIITGGFRGHGLVQLGGDPYKITVKTPTNVGTST